MPGGCGRCVVRRERVDLPVRRDERLDVPHRPNQTLPVVAVGQALDLAPVDRSAIRHRGTQRDEGGIVRIVGHAPSRLRAGRARG